jgi:hypothetical protein
VARFMVLMNDKSNNSKIKKNNGFVPLLRLKIGLLNPFFEMMLVVGALFSIGWIWLPFAYETSSWWFYYLGWCVLAFIYMWMSLISHWLRGRTLTSLGLSSHKIFGAKIEKIKQSGEAWNYFLIIGTVIAAYIIFNLYFLPFTDLIPILGMFNLFLVTAFPSPLFPFILAAGEFILIAVSISLFLFKTDNIKPSLIANAKYGTPFLLFVFTLALATSDSAYTVPFMEVITQFIGYIFWALFQQLPMVYIAISAIEGLHELGPPITLHTYRGRAALITASLFAVTHFPAWELSIIAFFMELVIVMIFLDSRYRNLFASCILHALAGVIVTSLMQIDRIVGFMAFLT